jgi:hypothetical protein
MSDDSDDEPMERKALPSRANRGNRCVARAAAHLLSPPRHADRALAARAHLTGPRASRRAGLKDG